MDKYKSIRRKIRKQRKIYRACINKLPFKTYEEAAAQNGMIVYKCRFCGYFHRSAKVSKFLARYK